MFSLAYEPGHGIAADGLRIAAYTPQQAPIRGGDDPPAHLRHGGDRQFLLANQERADLHVDTTLGCDARNRGRPPRGR